MRKAWLGWLAVLVLLAGCDEQTRRDQTAAPRAADAAPFESPSLAPAPPKPAETAIPDALKDAAAASPRDDGRALFDGEKPRAGLETGAGAVFAGAGAARRTAETLSNSPARKNTLTIAEPPPPGAGAGTSKALGGTFFEDAAGGKALPVAASAAERQSAAASTPGRNTTAAGPASGKPRIVYLGDSLSTKHFGFGPAMYAALIQSRPSDSIEMYAYGGSSPWWFLPGRRRVGMGSVYAPDAPSAAPTAPKIDELLKAGGVAAVIVEQGTNMINWGALKQGKPGGIGGLSDAAELARTIGAAGASCLWIGPPDMRGYRGSDPALVAQAIRDADAALTKAVAPHCIYIKSSDKTKYSGSDGIHQDARTGQAWAAVLLADPSFRLP